jgi:uncharacterized protein (TIGR03435 family)
MLFPTKIRRLSVLVWLACAMGVVAGREGRTQTLAGTPAAGKLEFDVISIRENKTGRDGNGDDPRVNIPDGPDDTFRDTGGVYTAVNMPLNRFIAFAYKITTSQRAVFRASLPEWAQTQGFNLEARTDRPHVTKDEMRQMMQSLLADRFKLKVHREMRDVPVYAVVLVKPGKLGPGLRLHAASDLCPKVAPPVERAGPDAPPLPPRTMADGFPAICGAYDRMQPTVAGRRREGSRDMPLATMVAAFSGLGNLGRPAVDQTGIEGNVDWVMEFVQETPDEPETDVDGPRFQDALKDQLGLKLVAQKASVEFVLVDHVEHPSAN